MPKPETKDALLGDAIEAQRRFGQEPDPRSVSRVLDRVLAKMDAKEREPRKAAAPPSVERSPVEVIESRDDGVEVYRRPIDANAPIRRAPAVSPNVRRLLNRIALLKTKPDWVPRLKAVNPLALAGCFGFDKQAQATRAIIRVCDDSDRLFGPWRQAPC